VQVRALGSSPDCLRGALCWGINIAVLFGGTHAGFLAHARVTERGMMLLELYARAHVAQALKHA
jgi:hypothetical protein